MSERNSTCSSAKPFAILSGPTSANGTRAILGLAAGEAADQVRVAEDARRGVPHHLLGQPGVRVGVLAQRAQLSCRHCQQLPQAIGKGTTTRSPTFRFLTAAPDLDDLAHELVAEDVALLHRRHEAVVEVQVGAADRGRGDLDDRVALVEDLRVGNVAHLDRSACPSSRSPSSPHLRAPAPATARCFEQPWPAPSRLPSERTTSPVSITCLKRRRSSRSCCARLLAEQLGDRRARLAGRRVVAQLDVDFGAAIGWGIGEADGALVPDVAAFERSPRDRARPVDPRRSRRPTRLSGPPAPSPPSATGRPPVGVTLCT